MGMSLHTVPPFLLIYPLPLGSTHFEWQWTPHIPPSNCPQSSIPPPLPEGSVPSAAAALRGGKRLLWQLNISQTARSDWVSPAAPSHSAPPSWPPRFKRTFQLLHVYNHWPYTAGLVPKRDAVLCFNEARGAKITMNSEKNYLTSTANSLLHYLEFVCILVSGWRRNTCTSSRIIFIRSDFETIILKLLCVCFAKNLLHHRQLSNCLWEFWHFIFGR